MKQRPRRDAADASPEREAHAQELAIAVARSLADAKCDEILVLDVRGLSHITDFLVIASGVSDRQMRTAAMKAEETGAEMGDAIFHGADNRSDTWIVVDFVDVVAHIFEPAARAHYDLELLWGDAPRIDWAAGRPRPAGAPGLRDNLR